MTTEKKIRSLVYVVVFLLITNVAMLLFILFTWDNRQASHSKNENLVGTFLQQQINFSERQMARYQKIRKEDYEKGKPLFEGIKTARDSFYNNLYKENVDDSTLNKLAGVVGEKQKNINMHMFQHFKNIRNICKPQQLPKFDSLFNEIVRKISAKRR